MTLHPSLRPGPIRPLAEARRPASTMTTEPCWNCGNPIWAIGLNCLVCGFYADLWPERDTSCGGVASCGTAKNSWEVLNDDSIVGR